MTLEVFDFLATRRSVKPDMLIAPGPTADELRQILTTGSRVPDHKKLAPWRFIIFEGEARARAGEIFADACMKEEREAPSPVRLELERNRFMRSPMVIGVVSSANEKAPAPVWEQVLSSGALCYNTCLAANALGFGTCWLSEWIAYSPGVKAALGLAEHERFSGFIYVGQRKEKPDERERPKLDDIVSYWPA